jgi:D-alanine-D-alanine ligase
MRVAIVFNEPAEAAEAAEADVLEQVQAVETALADGPYAVTRLPCTLDFTRLDAALAEEQPDVVVNLVEALGATDRLATLVPLLLDARGIRYTGAGSAGFLRCADKVAAKMRLRRAGLPTPDWHVAGMDVGASGQATVEGCFILKARYEHASLGMDDSAVVTVDGSAELERVLAERSGQHAVAMFAERFIAGREFNLALIERAATCESGSGVEVLPVAEIDFSAYPVGKPRIVGHAAKWAAGSFEYDATPRRFEFADEDVPLLAELVRLAEDTWQLFGLRGYARVDFRVDEVSRPWILEVNPNPCLAPDAGFAAALAAGGSDLGTALRRLLAVAVTG